MSKVYNRQIFNNNSEPALSASELNCLTKAVDEIDTRVDELGFTQTMVDKAQIAAVNAIGYAELAEAAAVNAIGYAELAEAAADRAMSATPEGYEEVASLAHQVPSKADKTELYHENLLDNGWFTVNQRGQSSYSSNTYTVDRWSEYYGHLTVTVSSNGINLKHDGTSSYNTLEQPMPSIPYGKTVTLSVKLQNGNIYTKTMTLPTSDVNFSGNLIEIGSYKIDVTYEHSKWNVRIYTNVPNAEIALRAIKLELGSISTLANDTIPNHAEELLRCQGSTADSGDTYTNNISGIALNETVVIYKAGNVKSVRIYANSRYAELVAGRWYTIATLPSGYRPNREIRFSGFDNAKDVLIEFIIATSGVVSFYATATTNQPMAYISFI